MNTRMLGAFWSNILYYCSSAAMLPTWTKGTNEWRDGSNEKVKDGGRIHQSQHYIIQMGHCKASKVVIAWRISLSGVLFAAQMGQSEMEMFYMGRIGLDINTIQKRRMQYIYFYNFFNAPREVLVVYELYMPELVTESSTNTRAPLLRNFLHVYQFCDFHWTSVHYIFSFIFIFTSTGWVQIHGEKSILLLRDCCYVILLFLFTIPSRDSPSTD